MAESGNELSDGVRTVASSMREASTHFTAIVTAANNIMAAASAMAESLDKREEVMRIAKQMIDAREEKVAHREAAVNSLRTELAASRVAQRSAEQRERAADARAEKYRKECAQATEKLIICRRENAQLIKDMEALQSNAAADEPVVRTPAERMAKLDELAAAVGSTQ